MENGSLNFEAPIQTRGSIRTRHASSEGAKAAGELTARQMLRVLTAYQGGPLTDIEVEAVTGIDKSSVIPRRRELQRVGLVVEVGHRQNPKSGKSNTTFGLAGSQ